jgi:DNA-binding ferritin-like protein
MQQEVCDILMKLYMYADVTKMVHYTTDKNHEHELCDIIRDDITSFADDLAEQFFGYSGKPSFSDFSFDQAINKTDNLGELCKVVSELVDEFRGKCESEKKLSNIVSLIDDFKGDMSKDAFLATFDKVSDYKIGG